MQSTKGYNPFNVGVIDELGQTIQSSSLTSVTVLTANTRNTAAGSLYQDPEGITAFTNPATSFVGANAVQWWAAASAFDVIVKLSNGICVRQNNVTPATNRIVVQRDLLAIAGVPTVAAATVTQYCYKLGEDQLRVDLFLDDVVVDVGLSATNAIGYGGTLLTTVPDGESNVNGIAGVAFPRLDDAQSQYANDATPEGTIGFGVAAKNDAADVGGSDANDDNLLGTGDYVMAAYVAGKVELKEAEGYTNDGTIPIYVNLSIDASELADTTGPNVRVDGWASFRLTYKDAS